MKLDEDDEDSDAGGDGGDEDYAASNQRAKHADEHEYEDEEDKDMDNKKTVMDEGFGEEEAIETDVVETDEVGEDVGDEPQRKEMTAEQEETIESRRAALLNKDSWIIDYEFDVEKSLSCCLTLSVGSTFLSLEIYLSAFSNRIFLLGVVWLVL